MKDNPCIRIGHLKIVDHLILGIAALQQKKSTPIIHAALETIAMNTWAQVCDGLTTGQIDGAFLPAPIAMDLFASGLDIRLLMLAHRGGSVIVKNKALDIKKLTDFKGHTILIPAELSVQNMLLHRLLSSAGLKFGAHDDRTADVTGEVAAPCLMAEMVMADADHDIAGFAVSEPFGSEAVQKKIAAPYCTTASLWKNHPCCVFALKSSVITQSFNAVNELVAGFVRAGQLLENRTPDSTLAMVQTFLEVNSDMVRQVLTVSDICFAPQLLIPDRRVLSLIQDYMADTMGIIKSKAPLDTLIDSSFITRALSEINP